MPQGDGHGSSQDPTGGRGPSRSGRRDGRDGKFDAQRDRGGRGRPRGDREASRTRAQPSDERPPRNANLQSEPEIAEDVDPRELDRDVRDELASLSATARTAVAGHLVMAGRLIDEDPARALEHALAARERAGRIGVVREAAGVAAYHAGEFAVALRELRAARRLTGSAQHLPLMADCERGLGRPRRALDVAADPAVTGLDTAGRMEMLIVAAGARRDLGEHAAAAVQLQVPELRARTDEPWLARLRYAYADALEAAGRDEEARRWFESAAEADRDGSTDAAERVVAVGSASSTG